MDMILLMLPPKTKTASPPQATPEAKVRLANHILAEGIQQGSFDVNHGSAAPEADPPRSLGTVEFISRFSQRMKEKMAELALSGFSSDAETLVHAAGIIAVLSPRPEELETLAAIFDARDRLAGREILGRLFDAGQISAREMSKFMSMENRMFPSLPGYGEVAGFAPSDEAPPTLRSVPSDPSARSKTKVSVTEGYTDPQGNSGYAFVAKFAQDP